MADRFNPLGGKIPTDKEASKDMKFLYEIISQICDYAVDNGLNPTDTVKTLGKNLILITEISSFDNWHRRTENESKI